MLPFNPVYRNDFQDVMKRILITGATGNIGTAVIRALHEIAIEAELIAAVRDIDRARSGLAAYPGLTYRQFDFEDQAGFASAFEGIDLLFLLRPPHISEVETVFHPLLEAAKRYGVKEIVFLSVQGAEKSKVIPHNKIEKLITEGEFSSVFIRPSYFMQNLTTTLLSEIQQRRSISLPSGSAKFNWIDVNNIGEACASVIQSFEKYKGHAYEITGSENKSFQEVTQLMSQITGIEFTFHPIDPIRFFFRKKKEGLPGGFALVMTILHFLPRFQQAPRISPDYHRLTGKEPTTLEEFFVREHQFFIQE